MKKVGLFLDSLPGTGGSFQYNLSMLEAFAQLPPDRFKVVIAYTSRHWEQFFQGRHVDTIFVNYHFIARVTGIALNLLKFPLRVWHILAPLLQKHSRMLLKEKCDLWVFPSQDVVAYQVKLPSLVTVLDLAHRVEKMFPESASGSEFLIRERTFTNICNWSKGVIVQTELGREQVVEAYGMSADKIHILPLVPPSYIYTTELPPEFNTRYRLPDKYLFYPAQFWAHKNHRNLLMALARLKSELPDLKLVLSGTKKNAYDSIVSMVNDLKISEDVLFIGYVPNEDMPELYRRARALVMPTYFGPSNIPPLEAGIAGCPIAISNVSSMSDQLGDAALIFDPDSVDEIADCIRRLWIDDHLCSLLAEKGKQQMAQWGQHEFNTRLAEIITGVIGQQPVHPWMNTPSDAHKRITGGLRTGEAAGKTDSTEPLVSIITVVKNGATHLTQCIESVLAQNWPAVEYILIDGGSTDATFDIIRRYEDRIDYWQSEPDQGIFDAMNKGISLANGDLIGLLNADDWFEPGAVESAATAFIEKRIPGIYYGDNYLVQVDLNRRYALHSSLEFWKGMTVCHQAMFVHRSVYQQVGCYDLRYRLAADFDFFLRALRNDVPFVPLGLPVVNYRDTGVSAISLLEGNREISNILRTTLGTTSSVYLKNLLLTGYNLAAVAVARIIGHLLGERARSYSRILYYRLCTRRSEDEG